MTLSEDVKKKQVAACPFTPSYCLAGGKCSFRIDGECHVTDGHDQDETSFHRWPAEKIEKSNAVEVKK